ncbi:Gfo/Idh/MocA family protein [Sphaerisporangium sp. NPDC049003]|uniref:Gfo/Idh/MocA family protein n=1 Tax=Sphaerisporangium sp. NPDC049003 TaxID=3364517 RepID=UPI00370FFA93
MSKALRAAVIGLGWAGGVHVKVLSSLDGVDLVAVADTDPERRVAFDGLRTAADVGELVRIGVDYCVVATPTTEHERISLELAAAGVHALIEKPLASTSAEATRLAEAFDRAGLVAAVGHTERRNAAVQELGARLRNGDYGSVYQVATRRNSPYPARIRDVGVVTDVAIHDVDLATWLTGRHITSVAAQVVHVTGGPHEDLATAVLRLGDDVIADIQVSRVSPSKERIVIVHTAMGCVTADALSRTITYHAHGEIDGDAAASGSLSDVPGRRTTYEVPYAEPFRVQHEAFRDALLGLPNDIVTLRQGVAAVEATEAILTAARTGTSVTFAHAVTSR